jgi:hypothetical protein
LLSAGTGTRSVTNSQASTSASDDGCAGARAVANNEASTCDNAGTRDGFRY